MVESSNFGTESVALQIATDIIASLRYKLIMIGVSIEGAANTFCDNESVYTNDSFAESQLNKNDQAICFHQDRECMAADIIIVYKIDTNDNF